mgnify:CR=1 FL=1
MKMEFTDMKEIIRHKIKHNLKRIETSIKWVLFAIISGVVAGGAGTLFYFGMTLVTLIRTKHPWLIFLLPFGGLVIVGCYRLLHDEHDTGTNLVISAIHSDDNLPLKMAPLIFISTLITHLFGGSAGREGAALQLGGSIGAKAGELLKLDEKDSSLVIMCGMSAVFAALFGTPLTATFFAMEVISVGVIYYVGLVPCIASSLIAYKISLLAGLAPTKFNITGIPRLSLVSVTQIAALAALCAVISILLCMVMEFSHSRFQMYLPNTYLRIAVGGVVIIALTLLVGTRDYNGAGVDVIVAALEKGKAHPEAFALKMLFTAITINTGFKGGEIVPTFFIGATFGCTAAGFLGLDPSFGAAIGLVALFCGVVNCPVASILLSYELFGGSGLVLFAVACGVSYMLSGYYGLYSSQKIMYSKTKPEYININAK